MSDGGSRWGGRRGTCTRTEISVEDARSRALFTGGGVADPLRAAAADIGHFFASRGRHRASAKPGSSDGLAVDRALGTPRELGAEFAGQGRHGGRGTVARDASRDY